MAGSAACYTVVLTPLPLELSGRRSCPGTGPLSHAVSAWPGSRLAEVAARGPPALHAQLCPSTCSKAVLCVLIFINRTDRRPEVPEAGEAVSIRQSMRCSGSSQEHPLCGFSPTAGRARPPQSKPQPYSGALLWCPLPDPLGSLFFPSDHGLWVSSSGLPSTPFFQPALQLVMASHLSPVTYPVLDAGVLFSVPFRYVPLSSPQREVGRL